MEIYNMKVKIKKLIKDTVIPKYAHTTDAGLDLTATSMTIKKGIVSYGTGIAMEIPTGYVGLVFPRSSIYKINLQLTNSVGVIDSGYRGEIMFKHRITNNEPPKYKVGDRIGQIIILPYPKIEFDEVLELSTSDRNTGGYGSTGK